MALSVLQALERSNRLWSSLVVDRRSRACFLMEVEKAEIGEFAVLATDFSFGEVTACFWTFGTLLFWMASNLSICLLSYV